MVSKKVLKFVASAVVVTSGLIGVGVGISRKKDASLRASTSAAQAHIPGHLSKANKGVGNGKANKGVGNGKANKGGGNGKANKGGGNGKANKGGGNGAPRFLPGNTFPAALGGATNLRVQGGGGPGNVVCGAVQAVLPHPTNANICFAGTTNGGVWRTTSCTSPLPDWVPLTDRESSNSVGDMVFGDRPNTLLVAIGTRSSLTPAGSPGIGGRGIGLLLTENALAPVPTWRNLDNGGRFRAGNFKFNSVYMRGDLILASANEPNQCDIVGIWRSTDRGVSWGHVLRGVGWAIAHDPNNNNRFYATLDSVRLCTGDATLRENGVFISNDQGGTWNNMPSQSEPLPVSGTIANAKLSVSRDGSRIWSVIASSTNGEYQNIAFSDNAGNSWTRMDRICIPLNATFADCSRLMRQGYIHLSMLASPVNRNEVYVGGSAQPDPFPNFVGATYFTGFLFRGDASTPTGGIPSPQWDHMTNLNNVPQIPGGGTNSNSAPHADSRDMELRVDGAILEGDDGGITIRTSPSDNTGDWFSLCGNMQNFEAHNLAYEPVLKSVVFATQDNGDVIGTLGRSGSFTVASVGDGGVAMYDYRSSQNSIFVYTSAQFGLSFQKWSISRQTGLMTQLLPITPERRLGFVPVTAMNPSDQTNFALSAEVGGFVLFYKFSTLTPTEFQTRTVDVFNDGQTLGITAMTYSANGRLLYSARGTAVSQCTIDPTSGFPVPPCTVVSTQAIPNGTKMQRMAVDPINPNRVVGVATNFQISGPRVLESVDGGRNWNDITGGGSIGLAYNGQAVAFLIQNQVSFLVVGTSNGIFLRSGQDWRLLAPGMPTVPVYDMTYSTTDDRLVVCTAGRGIWYLPNAFGIANASLGNVTPFTPLPVTQPGVTITVQRVTTLDEPQDAPPPDAAPADWLVGGM